MINVFILLIVAISVFPKNSWCLVAFDCAEASLNYSAIDLTQVKQCEMPSQVEIEETELIQLAQLEDHITVHAVSCKIKLYRRVSHCGLNSYSSEVFGGIGEYYEEVTESICKEIVKTKRMEFMGMSIRDITVNGTTVRNVLLAGSVDSAASCSGSHYSDRLGTWRNVVVQGTLTIDVAETFALVNTKEDEIKLNSNTNCKYSQGFCIDINIGYAFWDQVPSSPCNMNHIKVIWEGKASYKKENRTNQPSSKSITYYVSTPVWAFALTTKEKFDNCYLDAYVTEHPKLIIIKSSGNGFLLRQSKLQPSSLDFMTYINTKFVFVTRALQEENMDIFRKLDYQRCLSEYNALHTLLSTARHHPIDFAYAYLQQPGYTGTVAGEVIYLVKCLPVEVQVRRTTACYLELPVTYHNRSMFLLPRSHLLISTGSEVQCNELTVPTFNLNGKWVGFNPNPRPIDPPNQLSPAAPLKWSQHAFEYLATAGIYSQEDLSIMRESLVFHGESAATLTTLSSLVQGRGIAVQNLNLNMLINEEVVETMYHRLSHKLWGWFTTVGDVSSGILGAYVILRVMKFILDTIINCHLLYDVFGFSKYLIAGLITSLTHYFINSSNKNSQPAETLPMEQRERNRYNVQDEQNTALLDSTKQPPVLYPTFPFNPTAATQPLNSTE